MDWGGEVRAFFRDPDGHLFEISETRRPLGCHTEPFSAILYAAEEKPLTRHFAILVVLAASVASTVAAQSIPDVSLRNPTLLSPFDQARVFVPPDPTAGYLENYFQRALADPDYELNLAMNAYRMYGLERYELTRMESVLYGADRAAMVGLFAAAVGQFAGLWDERTSLYMTGAAAALGAAWGGTLGHGDDDWRIRFRWENDRNLNDTP